MYNNIGKKIKGLAKIVFWLEAIGVVFIGLAMFVEMKTVEPVGFVVAGVIGAWILSWLLYGFGEIIDKLSDIEKNTRGYGQIFDTQTMIDSGRMNMNQGYAQHIPYPQKTEVEQTVYMENTNQKDAATCPYCGAENKTGGVFCTNCGQRIM